MYGRIKRVFTITKRGAVEVILTAGLFWTFLFVFKVASATAYAYPRYDYGQRGWAFFSFVCVAIGLIVFSIIRLIQLRILNVLLMLSAFCLILSNAPSPDSLLWKFNTFKTNYLETVKAEPIPPPKFKIFSWGNRNTGLGGGLQFEAIVYDEMDNTNEWSERTSVVAPENRWVTTAPLLPSCHKALKSLGEHFYYATEVCN